MNKLNDMKERIKEKKARISAMVTMMILTMTTPAFAAKELETGKNIGEWLVDQIWYIALAVCAVMLVKCLIQKAWVQLIIFVIIGSICLFLISSPESLKAIGQSLFNMI